MLFYGNIGLAAGAGETLGRGHAHFLGLLIFQLAALYLIVPVLTAGAITAEKERGTLALLLVTTLSPRQIVLQKYASRMTPILSFVFLSFPLMAITYTFGGVTITDLVLGIVLLIYTCVALGAFAILCSACFRTTVEALCATYVGFPIFAVVFPGVCGLFWLPHPGGGDAEVTLKLVAWPRPDMPRFSSWPACRSRKASWSAGRSCRTAASRCSFSAGSIAAMKR